MKEFEETPDQLQDRILCYSRVLGISPRETEKRIIRLIDQLIACNIAIPEEESAGRGRSL